MSEFTIIQGGMGVAVSGWLLARAVSKTGQLGVVAGTALATVLARNLQLGDREGHLRRALGHFPVSDISRSVLGRYFIPGGKPKEAAFKLNGLPTLRLSKKLLNLTVLANFAEVFLAKDGHRGVVGLNLLEKIQLPTLASLYGAMLAGVDFVLMGAGIPKAIPEVLDRLAIGKPAELRIDVAGALPGEKFTSSFDPAELFDGPAPQLKRPKFIAIVSSATLATTLARKSGSTVHGFVIEGPTAGGHNAPPRGPLQLTAQGEPVYGPRDVPELEKLRALNLPFWLAGSYGRPGMLQQALQLGAAGIQVGTAFAFSKESGIAPALKERILQLSLARKAAVRTDPLASPTGFPLKTAQVSETLSDEHLYQKRMRICDLGYLRQAYRLPDGSVGYRCPGEPVADYLRKGGKIEETVGRKCVCNGLTATIGLAQHQRNGEEELALVTAGEDLAGIADFLEPGKAFYTAADVIARLLSSPSGNPGSARLTP